MAFMDRMDFGVKSEWALLLVKHAVTAGASFYAGKDPTAS